jgi:hypothetical protein
MILKPVGVPVPPVTVPVQVPNVAVAVSVADCVSYHPYHHPSNTLQVEFYAEPKSSPVRYTK